MTKPTKKQIWKILDKVAWPECMSMVEFINPEIITFTPLARLKCQNCGLYNRTPKCSPNNPSMEEMKNLIHSFKYGIIFVFQSDGAVAWKKDQVLNRPPMVGKQLKGTAAGMARSLNNTLHDISKYMRSQFDLKKDKEIVTLISGHCDVCGKCPLKDKYTSPGIMKECTKGYASLEAVGIDCYRLMKDVGVDHEIIPWNKVTLIGGIFL